MIRAATRNS